MLEGCLTCDIVSGKEELNFPLVLETEHFQVAQDFECYIPGFMIISPKRHVVSVRDFTSGERAEFYKIKYAVEDAIMSILGVGSVHHIEEKSGSTRGKHIHPWVFPGVCRVVDIGEKMEESKKDRVNQEQIEQVRRVNAEIKELLKSFPGNLL